MQYTPDALRRLHEIEMEILQEIIRVCEENGITYFTVGGTTLGAVRHNGFIPWDDDIDIGMMRDDYERFLKLAPQALHADFYLSHFSTQPLMPTYFAKVRRTGTEFIEQAYRNIPMQQGIFVDVFPFDYIPDDARAQRRYRRRVRLRWELFIAKSIKTSSATGDPRRQRLAAVVRGVLHFLLKPVSKKKLFDSLDNALRCCDDTPTNTISSRGYSFCDCKPDELLPPVPHCFEQLTLMVPADADKVLTAQYGDYMQLPPENARQTHSPLVLSFGGQEVRA